MNKEEIISKLVKFLEDKAKFAFVYGSILTKYFNRESDIDVAVYLGTKPDFKTLRNLSNAINQHFNYKYEFDLVLLDSADPIIAMQILANGKLILNNDFDSFVRYKARMISQYLDLKMDRKIIEDKISEGSIYA
jgi:predicted nucleotidyltransferase